MKEKPIIFNAAMVRAIIEGRKTQARQILNADTPETRGGRWDFIGDSAKKYERHKWCYSWIDQWGNRISPKMAKPGCLVTPPCLPGGRLWVRENWAWYPLDHDPTCVIYRADYPHGTPCPPEYERWRPCIHMPRWASRILLEVTAVRVERLQDISEADAIAEGIESTGDFFECPCWRDYMEPDPDLSSFPDDPVGSYASLWESIYGPDSWDQNPWVWVIEFKRISQ